MSEIIHDYGVYIFIATLILMIGYGYYLFRLYRSSKKYELKPFSKSPIIPRIKSNLEQITRLEESSKGKIPEGKYCSLLQDLSWDLHEFAEEHRFGRLVLERFTSKFLFLISTKINLKYTRGEDRVSPPNPNNLVNITTSLIKNLESEDIKPYYSSLLELAYFINFGSTASFYVNDEIKTEIKNKLLPMIETSLRKGAFTDDQLLYELYTQWRNDIQFCSDAHLYGLFIFFEKYYLIQNRHYVNIPKLIKAIRKWFTYWIQNDVFMMYSTMLIIMTLVQHSFIDEEPQEYVLPRL